jgi:hypothetical protein
MLSSESATHIKVPLSPRAIEKLFEEHVSLLLFNGVMNQQEEQAQPLSIVPISVAQVNEDLARELQDIQEVPVFQSLQHLVGYVVEAAGESLKSVSLKQFRVDAFQEFRLRKFRRLLRQHLIQDADGKVDQFLSDVQD